MNQTIEQYALYWVDLNPTKGAGIADTREYTRKILEV